MATTTYGTTYATSADLVSAWPTASLSVANSVDAAGYYIGRGINAQTASYTTVLTDAGKTVTMTNAGATTLTIPANASVAYVVGTRINILNLGAGACTPTAGAGVTISGTITALAQNGSASVVKTATNTWSYVPFGSGTPTLTVADVSATTGSPTTGSFTDGDGIAWSFYQYQTGGSITFSRAGYVDSLVVGGGAGGSSGSSVVAGGGGGGVRFGLMMASAATHTITIGAGGAGGSSDMSGTGGTSSFGSILKCGGGGSAYASNAVAMQNSGFGGGGSHGASRAATAATVLGGGAGGLVYGSALNDGISLNYTGASVAYGGSKGTAGAGTNYIGEGGLSNNVGGIGLVVVKVRT
jgi:hypothetical protein